MRFTENVKETVRFVRAQLGWRQSLIAAAIAVVFFLLVGLAPNISFIWNAMLSGDASYALHVLGGLIVGIFTGQASYVTVFVAIVGVLTGINVALIVARAVRVRGAGTVGLGSLLGLTLTGCPSCATGILPLLGLTAGVGFLPFGGIELSILSIGILLFALYWNATSERCEVPQQ